MPKPTTRSQAARRGDAAEEEPEGGVDFDGAAGGLDPPDDDAQDRPWDDAEPRYLRERANQTVAQLDRTMRELKEGREEDQRRLERSEQALRETSDDLSQQKLGYERALRRASDEFLRLTTETTRNIQQKDLELNETRRLLDQALLANMSRQPPTNLTHRDGGPAPPSTGGSGRQPAGPERVRRVNQYPDRSTEGLTPLRGSLAPLSTSTPAVGPVAATQGGDGPRRNGPPADGLPPTWDFPGHEPIESLHRGPVAAPAGEGGTEGGFAPPPVVPALEARDPGGAGAANLAPEGETAGSADTSTVVVQGLLNLLQMAGTTGTQTRGADPPQKC